MPDSPHTPLNDDLADWIPSESSEDNAADEWATEDDSEEESCWEIVAQEESEELLEFEVDSDADGEHGFDEVDFAPTTIVGHREHGSLPQLGLHQMLVRFSSDSSLSTFHAEIHQSRGDHITFKLDQLEIELPAFEQANDLWVALQLELAGVVLEGVFKVVSTSGQPYLVVGRDIMAGQLLIDPSGEWLKSRR